MNAHNLEIEPRSGPTMDDLGAGRYLQSCRHGLIAAVTINSVSTESEAVRGRSVAFN